MRIALLGAPGSGKGMQAESLAVRYRVPRISTGDLLRAAAADDDKLDAETSAAVLAGQPVADEVVLALLDERLRARDSKRGYIIDGFPGNIPQAQALDTLLGMLGRALQITIHVKVDDKTLVQRITGRMRCEQCGAVYNRQNAPPKVRGKCDNCDGKVVAASDDNAKTAAVRVREYQAETTPLLAYYKAQHKLRTVAAGGDVEEIQQKICDIVDLELRPLEVKTLETAAQTLEEGVNTVIAGGQISRITPPPENSAKRARTIKSAATKAASIRTSGAPSVKKKSAKKKTTGTKVSKKASKKVSKQVSKKAAKKPTAKTAVKKKSAKKKTAKKKTTAKKAASRKPAARPVAKKKATKKSGKKTTAKKSRTKKSTARRKTAGKKTAGKKKRDRGR